MPKILAFIDASAYAGSVIDHAAWAAGRMSASIEVFHVLESGETTSGDLTGALDFDARDLLLAELSALDEQRAKLAQQRGRLILDRAKERLAAAGIGDVKTKLRSGDLVEAMQQFEHEADLLVVGKRGEAADFAKLHLGSNLERIVRASSKPVFVASRKFEPIKRVLIAFDGGSSITRGVNYLAGAHSAFAGLDLTILKVGNCTDDAAKRVEMAAGQLRSAGYAVEASVVPGQPEQIIEERVASGRFDLLVMGAYGHSRIRNLIIGSTTTAMIRACKIPVVLFR